MRAEEEQKRKATVNPSLVSNDTGIQKERKKWMSARLPVSFFQVPPCPLYHSATPYFSLLPPLAPRCCSTIENEHGGQKLTDYCFSLFFSFLSLFSASLSLLQTFIANNEGTSSAMLTIASCGVALGASKLRLLALLFWFNRRRTSRFYFSFSRVCA